MPALHPRWAHGSVAGAGLAAVAAGLLGLDGGLLAVVLGVWTVRTAAGARPGLAWGLACAGAGVRWGTFSIADVQAATRAVGPGVGAGPVLVAAASTVALLAALVDEVGRDGLASGSLAERTASAAALVVLVPAFLAPGVGGLGWGRAVASAAWWLAAAAALGALAARGAAVAARVPGWLSAGVAVAAAVATPLVSR